MSHPRTDAGPAEAGPAGRLTARLARAGFADPVRAAGVLTTPALRLWDPERNEASDPAAAAVLSALGRVAAPDQALAMLAELARTDEGPDILAELRTSAQYRTRLLCVLGASQALA